MGIFDSKRTLFTDYRTTLVFRDKIMGGIPQDPEVVEGWLRAKAKIGDERELMAVTARTLEEIGVPVGQMATLDELKQVSKIIADEQHTNGFKRDERGLYIEGRQVKAMIKENVNILLSGKTLKTGGTIKRTGADLEKAARSVVAERVHVAEQRIYLDRDEPDGVDLFMGHVEDRAGRRSTLTKYQYCLQPTITFTVRMLPPCLSEDQWADLWLLAQENGLGALRSQSHGRFDIEQWTELTKPQAVPELAK